MRLSSASFNRQSPEGRAYDYCMENLKGMGYPVDGLAFDPDLGTYRVASWRGTQVAVKKLAEEVTNDDDKVRAFIDELALLQKIRHPNVVQFLGVVTQSSPMMIVTEYLPKGIELFA